MIDLIEKKVAILFLGETWIELRDRHSVIGPGGRVSKYDNVRGLYECKGLDIRCGDQNRGRMGEEPCW